MATETLTQSDHGALGDRGIAGRPAPGSASTHSTASRRDIRDLRVRVVDRHGYLVGHAPGGRHGRPFLSTVLITDIVDSTLTVVGLGDRRWRDLLAEHYAGCRAQVNAHGGTLANSTGDGIVATFDAPSSAIRAAIAIQAIGRGAGLAVRAGVHTGECERLWDSLAGLTVHIAARICALGDPDEVIATSTVRDLTIGSMLAFAPRGLRELRGVPGLWAVFGVVDPTQRGVEVGQASAVAKQPISSSS